MIAWIDAPVMGPGLAGGLFPVWKATHEIHQTVSGKGDDSETPGLTGAAAIGLGAAIAQIVLLDIVFSVDSILTAVGMTDNPPVMVVVFAVGLMLVAADPLANFINRNPTVVTLPPGFLLMIGMVLIAEAFGAHIPKGCIYTAMAFSAGVEGLSIFSWRARQKTGGA